jgi:cell surface protein SprA
MTQRFTIAGKIGEKVQVDVNQDSERLFDFENSLKLTYTGDKDEIIQKSRSRQRQV